MVRVSIIIPCFNRQDLLVATLESLRAQTYPHWEAIIVDDCSHDHSLEVAQSYASNDIRFRAVSRRGDLRGANVCRNQGLSLAQGEFVVFLDSDDLLLNTSLENRVAAMDRTPGCAFGVFVTELFNVFIGDTRVLLNLFKPVPDLYRFLSNDSVWHTTGPIWRKRVVQELGGFDEALPCWQDWDLSVRALIARLPYFKEAVRDHFYRSGPSHPNAITADSSSQPARLRSLEELLANTLIRLHAAGLLDDEARRRVAGLFWSLARGWQKLGRRSDAGKLWRKASGLGLFGHLYYLEGLLVLRLLKIRGGGRLGRLIQLTWPKTFCHVGWPYFKPAAVSSGSGPSSDGLADKTIFGGNISMPKVSIGLPVYNGEGRIGRALDSILKQDFSDFEVIISDNASTDGTRSICECYARQDKRIRYYRNESNIGVNPNHDRVFELSHGEYFAWFADDVEYLAGMLGRCVQAMDAAPASVVLIYPGCEMIRDGQPAADDDVSVQSNARQSYERMATVIRQVYMVNHLYGLARRAALAKTRLNGLYASSDCVLLAELAMLGEIRELPMKLIRRRIDSNRGTAAVFHDARAWKAWSGVTDKGLINKYLSNRERLAIEYLRGAWHVPIKPMDKLKCLTCILPVYYARTSSKARFVLRLVNPWQWKRGSFNAA